MNGFENSNNFLRNGIFSYTNLIEYFLGKEFKLVKKFVKEQAKFNFINALGI